MRRLTEENTARALARNRERKCHVRAVAREGPRLKFHVTCDRGHVHAVEIERRDGGLYGRCFYESTGEVCPSELGGRVCYHITAALALFLWLEREAGRGAVGGRPARAGDEAPACKYARTRRRFQGRVREFVGPHMI